MNHLNQTQSTKTLAGINVAILIASGITEADMTHTHRALIAAGAKVKVVSMDKGLVTSWSDDGWGHNFASDAALNETLACDFDMLVVPGGQRAVDKLQTTAHTKRFVGGFIEQGKRAAIFGESRQLLEELGDMAHGANVFTAGAEIGIEEKVAGMMAHFEQPMDMQEAA